MIWKNIYTKTARKDLKKLDAIIRKRVNEKMKFFASQENPLLFASPLTNQEPATHRFRIGDYRAKTSFKISIGISEQGEIIIYRIQHRREVYQ